MRALLLALGFWASALPLSADEALLPNGRRLVGELRWQEGRLRLATTDRLVLLADVHQVRCTAQEPTLLAGVVHCVLLRDGQQITGELLQLNGETLRVRTAWSPAPIEVPRCWVREVSNPPGFVPILDEDFASGLKTWKLAGSPGVTDDKPPREQRGLLLDSAGQSATLELPESLSAGQFGLSFYDSNNREAGRWILDVGFQKPAGPRLLQVNLAGETEHYAALLPNREEKSKQLPRQQGWHRATMRFSPQSFVLLIDDKVLWDSAQQGPGGPLAYLRLSCTALPGQTVVNGKMWFDQVSVWRAVDYLRPPLADPLQDEVRLVSGDQLFGRVLSADRRRIDFEGRFGRRSFAWSEVRDIRLRHAACPLAISDGEHVHLQLACGSGAAADAIEGVLRRLGQQSLILQHGAVEVTIPRERLRQVQTTFHGRRVELDNQLHHLGRDVQAGFSMPRPEGLSLQCKFSLKDVPDRAELVIEAAHLKGPGDSQATAQALERGGQRTAVVLNSRDVDYLNRWGERSSAEPHRLRLPVPRGVLHAGENVLELRQTLDRATGLYASCMISRITLEMPR